MRSSTNWVHWQRREPFRTPKSRYIGERGRGSSLDDEPSVVRVRHVVGFAREDWGEGNWTAKDLR